MEALNGAPIRTVIRLIAVGFPAWCDLLLTRADIIWHSLATLAVAEWIKPWHSVMGDQGFTNIVAEWIKS